MDSINNRVVAIEPDSSMRSCSNCGTLIPKNVKICWSCGEILDRPLRELKEAEG